MIKAGIIGGGGYTAGELIRILQYHPETDIAYVHSHSQQGKEISSIHQDLIGENYLQFTGTAHFDIDVLFLCMGHGKSQTFLEENEVPDDVVVVDLSRDYRLTDEFVYGLPELNRSAIMEHTRIANPGCFATAIQLALLPLAADALLSEEVHIHAMTGSTGAGQSPSTTTHFSWRNNNVSVYKAFHHQHLGEIRRSIEQLQPGFQKALNFIPVRGNFTRGILASVYTATDLSEDALYELYETYYQDHPFVFVTADNPHLKQVVNTNKCLLHLEKHGDKVLIISTIDNLVKGASGQAVQNMNLALGFDEALGLWLKPTAF